MQGVIERVCLSDLPWLLPWLSAANSALAAALIFGIPGLLLAVRPMVPRGVAPGLVWSALWLFVASLLSLGVGFVLALATSLSPTMPLFVASTAWRWVSALLVASSFLCGALALRRHRAELAAAVVRWLQREAG